MIKNKKTLRLSWGVYIKVGLTLFWFYTITALRSKAAFLHLKYRQLLHKEEGKIPRKSHMKSINIQSSQHWYNYFQENLQKERIDWNIRPHITQQEKRNILKSLQAWQLGETSDGSNLIKASQKFCEKEGDFTYLETVKLFIKEEQKHGSNLGRYIDEIGEKRISKNWGDSLFRHIRYLNNNMELWTLAVITVESAAQIFYQALRDATGCMLLQQICRDILIDEAFHIDFQLERLAIIFKRKGAFAQSISLQWYTLFFKATTIVVWLGHKRLFKAGNNDWKSYWRKMNLKYHKTIGRLQEGITY